MNSLRHAHNMTRLVLAWFVLSLGAAVAAPLMTSQDSIMVCSSNGMYLLMPDDADPGEPGQTSRSTAKLKCPLCLLLDAPPDLLDSSARMSVLPTASLVETLSPSAPCANTCAAPLPARGPPSHVKS